MAVVRPCLKWTLSMPMVTEPETIYSQSRPQTTMNMTRSRSIPAVEKRSSSFEVRKLAGADLEMCGNSSFRTGPVMDPLLNLTQTNPQHEHGATWKRNGVCARKEK